MFKNIFSNSYAKIGAVAVFTPFLFFAIMSILSIEYSGLSDSNSYVYTLVVTWAVFLIFYFLPLNQSCGISDFLFIFLLYRLHIQ